MRGSFYKREQAELLDDAYIAYLKDLEYLSNAEDKRNIKGDIKRLSKDFDKAKKQAKVEFNINL